MPGATTRPMPTWSRPMAPRRRSTTGSGIASGRSIAAASQPLEARARSYLHTNCAHCHVDGGGGSVDLRLHHSVTNDEMKAIGVRASRGDFALPNAAIIKPGDPWASTLYFRMAKFGRDRMPHLGSERPDETGLDV